MKTSSSMKALQIIDNHGQDQPQLQIIKQVFSQL